MASNHIACIYSIDLLSNLIYVQEKGYESQYGGKSKSKRIVC